MVPMGYRAFQGGVATGNRKDRKGAVVVFIIESAKIGIILEAQMECSLYCFGNGQFFQSPISIILGWEQAF